MLSTLLKGAGGAGGAGGAIEYVGGYTEGFTGTTFNKVITFGGNLTGGLDSSASEGDFVLVWFATASNTNRDLVVAGYTEIDEAYQNDQNDTNLVVAYKFMGSTPNTTVTLTGGTFDVDDAGTIVVQVFRNVDPTNPLDVTATTAQSGNSVLADPPAITPVTEGAWVVAGGAGAHSSALETYSSSDLTNFISSAGADTYDSTIGAGYYPTWTSGSFDPAAFTFSAGNSGNFSWAAATVALRPGPYTTPPVTLNTTNIDAAPSTTYTFNYGASVGVGEFVVIVLTTRSSSGTGNWSSVSDSAGNTFTEAVDGTQPNDFTYTAIYYGTLTNAVTTSTTITASCNSAGYANHATVYVLTEVTGLAATNSNPTTSSSSISATATTTSGVGIAIHGISSGVSGGFTVSSVSAGFTTGSTLGVSGCTQATAYGVFNTTPSGSISNTFNTSVSANYASVMALFE